jgi:hypothetical protein
MFVCENPIKSLDRHQEFAILPSAAQLQFNKRIHFAGGLKDIQSAISSQCFEDDDYKY